MTGRCFCRGFNDRARARANKQSTLLDDLDTPGVAELPDSCSRGGWEVVGREFADLLHVRVLSKTGNFDMKIIVPLKVGLLQPHRSSNPDRKADLPPARQVRVGQEVQQTEHIAMALERFAAAAFQFADASWHDLGEIFFQEGGALLGYMPLLPQVGASDPEWNEKLDFNIQGTEAGR